MKTKKEMLENYKELETSLDVRFIKRVASYLTANEVESLGYEIKDKKSWTVDKEWTEENIINNLISDAEFGLEKAENQRGISSALMLELVEAWLWILEDESLNKFNSDTGYGEEFFKEILLKYKGESNDREN